MRPKAIEAYHPTVYTTKENGIHLYRWECYYTEAINGITKDCHAFGGPYKTFEKAEVAAKKFYFKLTRIFLGDDIDMTL